MAYDVAALRAYGARRVTVRTEHGTFEGSFAEDSLTPASVMVLFARDGGTDDHIVIPIDSITGIAER